MRMQTVLIVDDDPEIANALAQLIECRGREVIVCGDLESAEIAVEQLPVACVISDVRLSSPFRFEGLDFIAHVKRHAPRSSIVLMTGALTNELAAEALARGASAVLAKPFDSDDLTRFLGQPGSSEESRIVRMPGIDEIVDGNQLFPLFQPIVDLSTPALLPHGFESLARLDTPGLLASPQALFDYANRKGRVVDLEIACIRATFARCGSLVARGARIFLNLHPAVIVSDRLRDVLTSASAAANIAPSAIVLEITEQQSLGDAAIVGRQCAALRELGFTFALDDVGVAYSHLTHIDQIRPAYLKISQDFGTSFESDVTRTKIVRNILSLARELGCELVLEGIETTATRDAAHAAGIGLGQGYLFGRPAPAIAA
jgi:EAL domain-containing protein (putative c-di-GMP-specific phosphodiesterase class I)